MPPDSDDPVGDPGSIKDLILEQDEAASLVRNRRLLDPDEIVDEDRIVGRNDQLTQITQYLRVAINNECPPNLFLYGPSGTGKSLIINAVCQNVVDLCSTRDIRFGVIELNCQNVGTLGTAVYELVRTVADDADVAIEIPEHGIPTKKKWRELYRLIDEHYDSVMFVLDELDLLTGRRDIDEPAYSRLLYQLTRTGSIDDLQADVAVTAISNDTKMMEDVGSRALSSFTPEDVHFSDYDANQLREILGHREDAFHDDALSEDVIPLAAAFAAQTHGDARIAIDLMRTAGTIAERDGADQVREEHVRIAQDKVVKNRVLEVTRGISTQKKLCLFATAAVARETENTAAKSTEAYRVYQYITETLDADQHYQETYVNKMKELTTYSLVKSGRKSQGPHSGSYLEFTFEENPQTIIETLREDSRLDGVADDELRTVVRAQLTN
ncbi:MULTISPECIES: orc1/cdc6 family replication initiation protein [Halarchaeum]|uniref:ORC1-type DNA replication protein n=2 Tax=Halarchaeum TaxID=744724 RepID=U2YET7_9EURY|nr:orc1/cdc6 family replication initiation protein [Halarchaeum acidiphilum]GAD52366.1 origin of replication recognition protein / Cell division control protein 6 [Halarchaeum acidiphilum MH1-52-1]